MAFGPLDTLFELRNCRVQSGSPGDQRLAGADGDSVKNYPVVVVGTERVVVNVVEAVECPVGARVECVSCLLHRYVGEIEVFWCQGCSEKGFVLQSSVDLVRVRARKGGFGFEVQLVGAPVEVSDH